MRMMIKTLFLASFMIASALASDKPYPAALLVQSNFDFSLTRKEFRVHYGGPRAGSNPTHVSIKIYKPNSEEALSYDLKDEKERKTSQAFHFALDKVEDGKYEVEVCEGSGEGSVCSARTPSLNDVVAKSGVHTLSCESKNSGGEDIEVNFAEPKEEDWAEESNYKTFENTVTQARRRADPNANYQTDRTKYSITKNPSYQKDSKRFHAAIMHDLKTYKPFFDTTQVDEYCGRKYMLSLHSHIVDKETKKVVRRYKTVNHLSEGGKQLFILGQGGKILLETTHKDVETLADGTYELLVSLCVTDKDTIESTYCASPIKRDLTVGQE